MLNRIFSDHVIIELISADLWQSVYFLNAHDIPVYCFIQTDSLAAQLEVDRKYVSFIQKSLGARGDSVQIQKHSVLARITASILSRPILIVGSLILAVILLVLPQKILILEVEGNVQVPAKQILQAAQNGFSFWDNCKDTRSEQVKNILLSAIPQLQWAGVNTYGCRGVISVREKTLGKNGTADKGAFCNVVASSDGIIYSASALQGTLMCAQGDSVRSGQLLISGYIDCGNTIQATQAQGEIYAETIHYQNGVSPLIFQKKTGRTATAYAVSICIEKKRIFLWKDSGIWDTKCDRISKEFCLTLPGGYSLPFSLQIDKLERFQTAVDLLPAADRSCELQYQLRQYLMKQMIAGTIQSSEENTHIAPDYLMLKGVYHCIEMIGRAHFEEIGDLYGKNS